MKNTLDLSLTYTNHEEITVYLDLDFKNRKVRFTQNVGGSIYPYDATIEEINNALDLFEQFKGEQL